MRRPEEQGPGRRLDHHSRSASSPSLFECFGAGLLDFGVKRGDHVGLISENRKEWMIANLGILGIGAADVPRGSDTMPEEAAYILRHADCAVALAENAEQVKKILGKKQDLPLLKTIIVMDEGSTPASVPAPAGVELLTLRADHGTGRRGSPRTRRSFQREMEKGKPEDLATIIYTSGTTGEPKGVMLTHSNFLHNLRTIPNAIHVGPGRYLPLGPSRAGTPSSASSTTSCSPRAPRWPTPSPWGRSCSPTWQR